MSKEEKLSAAIKSGDLPTLEKCFQSSFLSKPMDIDARLKFGYTPLILAVSENQKAVAEFLIGRHADVNARDDYGMTVLMCAAGKGNKDMVEFLLQKGADPGIQERDGTTALDWARKGGHTAIMGLLEPRAAGEKIPKAMFIHLNQPSLRELDQILKLLTGSLSGTTFLMGLMNLNFKEDKKYSGQGLGAFWTSDHSIVSVQVGQDNQVLDCNFMEKSGGDTFEIVKRQENGVAKVLHESIYS